MLTWLAKAGTASVGIARALADAAPWTAVAPLPVSARTWNVYSVPLLRPVTVWLVVLALLPVIAPQSPQFEPPSVLCRTSQPEMPLSPAFSHLSVTASLPGVAKRVAGLAGATPMSKTSEALSGLVASLSVAV